MTQDAILSTVNENDEKEEVVPGYRRSLERHCQRRKWYSNIQFEYNQSGTQFGKPNIITD